MVLEEGLGSNINVGTSIKVCVFFPLGPFPKRPHKVNIIHQGLPRTRRHHESTWFIVDRLTKSSPLIPLKSTYRAEDYARHCIDDIVKWNMIYWSIISYREAQFTSHF